MQLHPDSEPFTTSDIGLASWLMANRVQYVTTISGEPETPERLRFVFVDRSDIKQLAEFYNTGQGLVRQTIAKYHYLRGELRKGNHVDLATLTT